MPSRNKSSPKQFGRGLRGRSVKSWLPPPTVTGYKLMPPQDITCSVAFGPDVPDWKAAIADNTSATTTLQGTDLTCTGNADITGVHIMRNPVNGDTWESWWDGDAATLCDVPAPNFGSTTKADNAALTAFVQSCHKAQRSFQGLVALGELRETVNLIRHPLMAFRSYCDSLRKAATLKKRIDPEGHKRRSKKFRRAMTDTWLEWAFGAAPLLNDIQAGAQALARRNVYNPPTANAFGFATDQWAKVAPEKALLTHDRSQLQRVVETTSTVQIGYYGKIKTNLSLSGVTSSQFGCTPWDILPAAWELIPYSFLVDYFSNVGAIVDGISFCKSSVCWVNKKSCGTLTNRLVSVEFTYTPDTPTNVTQVKSLYCASGCEITRTSKHREPYTGSFVPSLEFKIPGPTSTKWLNIAALVASGREINGTIRR